MSEKFLQKYRIPSSRLQNYDYSQNGYYFITICTKDREHYFGQITDGKIQPSEIGKMAQKFWLEIPNHFPFVILDEFIVMPNHVHGILVIEKNNNDVRVETQNLASLQIPPQNKFGPQSKNLASIIRGYKIGVKKY